MSEIKVQTVRTEVSPRQVSSAPQVKSAPQSEVSPQVLQVNLEANPKPQVQTVTSRGQQGTLGAPKAVSDEEVQAAVAKLNEFVQSTDRRLDFQIDEDSGRSIIRVYDKDTEELVRQIPSEQALELARRLGDEEPSFLFNAEV